MILLIIYIAMALAGVVGAGYGIAFAGKKYEEKKALAVANKPLPLEAHNTEFSWAGRQLLEMNQKLPIEHRVDGLTRIIKALDTKYMIKTVDEHFVSREYYEGVIKRIDGHACHGICPMKEYKDIYKGIQAVKDALFTQKRAVEINSVKHDLDDVDDYIAKFKQEVEMIGETTLAITAG